MKKLLIIAILVLTPYISICQTISTLTLTREQSLELYKGLKQGESLKNYTSTLKELNSRVELITKKDSIIKSDYKKEIQRLNEVILSQEKLAKKSEEEKNLEIEKAIKKSEKHWSIGPVAAYGLSIQKEPSFQSFIGVGISYSIFKF